MADRTDYRDPNVTTSRDASSGGMPSWLKWVLVALAIVLALWLILSFFDMDETGGVTTTADPDAVIVEEGAETEILPVVPAE
jgi:hypothetical protein